MIPRVLLTSFEPYEPWQANASWLTIVELTKEGFGQPEVTTRLYPVDFAAMQEKLSADLATGYDYALHLGQAPGAEQIRLEAIGLNIGGSSKHQPEEYQPLVADGPVAYRSALPLAQWSIKLQENGIPAQISYHAGTFLCNAILFLSHYLSQQHGYSTKAAFIHVPLDGSQAVGNQSDIASLPTSVSAAAVRMILNELMTL